MKSAFTSTLGPNSYRLQCHNSHITLMVDNWNLFFNRYKCFFRLLSIIMPPKVTDLLTLLFCSGSINLPSLSSYTIDEFATEFYTNIAIFQPINNSCYNSNWPITCCWDSYTLMHRSLDPFFIVSLLTFWFPVEHMQWREVIHASHRSQSRTQMPISLVWDLLCIPWRVFIKL